MNGDSMDLFDNLDQAEAFENSKHFAEGRYIVRMEACKFRAGGHKGDSFIIETTVVAAIAEDGMVRQAPGETPEEVFVEYPRPGDRASQVWGAGGSAEKIQQGRGTWIAFLCAAFGCQKADFDGPQWKAHSAQVIDGNYLKGQLFVLDCHVKRTKRKDGPFTVHNWRGVPSAEQLAEFGLAADGTPVPGAVAATPAAAAKPQPIYAVDAASGRQTVSYDGGTTLEWA